jgi:precorrin isomerase
MDSLVPSEWWKLFTALSVLGDILKDLIVKLASATTDEIPALRAQAEALTQRVIECCADTASVDHLSPKEATAIRTEILQLAEAMKAQIASIVDVRLAPFTGGATSQTLH